MITVLQLPVIEDTAWIVPNRLGRLKTGTIHPIIKSFVYYATNSANAMQQDQLGLYG